MNIERFLSKIKIDKSSGCWIWVGSVHFKGYGRFSGDFTHRRSYKIFKDSIAPGMVIDHVCRNRICCNPDHLRCVTSRVNAIENSIGFAAKNYRKTKCKYGHEFDDKNTRLYIKNGRSTRVCRKCSVNNNAKYRIKYGRKYK